MFLKEGLQNDILIEKSRRVIKYPFTYLFKSLFKSISEASVFLTTEESEVPSANDLGLNPKFSDKSLIKIKNNSGPRIESWGYSSFNLGL